MNIYVVKQPHRVAKMLVAQTEAWKNNGHFNNFREVYYALCRLVLSFNEKFKMRGFMSVYCKSDENMDSGEITIVYIISGKPSVIICLINF